MSEGAKEVKRVKWGRPEKNKFGDVAGYRSKCGRFYIERREYVLPSSSVGYNIYYIDCGKSKREDYDTLRDAKDFAECLADPEAGYELSTLPDGFKS